MTQFDSDALHRVTMDAAKAAHVSSGLAMEVGGWLLVDSETGIAALNQAVALGGSPQPDLAAVERWFAERGTGFRVTTRVPGDEAVVAAARADGWTIERSQPLMARGLPLDEWRLPHGVSVGVVCDAESVRRYLAVREERAQGHPPDEMEGPFILGLVAGGHFRYFFAEEGGAPVATAMSFASPPYVSVSNVFVRTEARNRGFGAAMTALAVASVPGAEVACLSASVMGEPVYRRMGFDEQFRYVQLQPPEPG